MTAFTIRLVWAAAATVLVVALMLTVRSSRDRIGSFERQIQVL